MDGPCGGRPARSLCAGAARQQEGAAVDFAAVHPGLKDFRHDYSGRLLFFHTIEPAISFMDRKCPKALAVHNDIEKQIAKGQGEVLWGTFPWLYFRLEKRIMPFMDHVYTVRGETLGIYQSQYAHDRKRFSFLPTWVDDGIVFPSAGSRVAARMTLCARDTVGPVDAKWILFTGRFHTQENPLRMVHAFFEYQRTDPRSILILIGGGNMRAQIVHSAEHLGIASKIFVLTEQRQIGLAEYYRCAGAFLLTSHHEGMSVSVLEALASGLPVVSTDTGEVRRVVKNGWSGEIADDNSPTAISQSIETVLNNPRAYSSKNCLDAVSDYTAQTVLTPLYGALRQLQKG